MRKDDGLVLVERTMCAAHVESIYYDTGRGCYEARARFAGSDEPQLVATAATDLEASLNLRRKLRKRSFASRAA